MARSDTWHHPHDPTPQAVFHRWLDAVNAGDVDALMDLYDDSAVLVPTFSQAAAGSPEGIRAYFDALSDHPSLQVVVQADSLLLQHLGGPLYGLHGRYQWSFRADGRLRSFAARFSLTIDTARPQPILSHHSSQDPR